MERFIQSGDGWRIGWHPHGSKYQGLVGANDWAIELTKAELNDFCRLLNQLVETMSQMKAELMEEEKISCEAETDLLWIEVEGYPDRYSLRLIIHSDRRCEGNWTEGIAPNLVTALERIKDEL
ncbi:MAG: DUF1818 family protein [Pleurocapsa sp. MO_192.B19]|nr:DUF1818 family protein [Pleurocapsa sp. MO_192.B19]